MLLLPIGSFIRKFIMQVREKAPQKTFTLFPFMFCHLLFNHLNYFPLQRNSDVNYLQFHLVL
jgi:hypothetical protein